MKRETKIGFSIFFFILIMVGPLTRAIGYLSFYFYLISLVGLVGLITVDRLSKKKARMKIV
ncbi:hypothetical protein J2S74_004780 [Evansella vedderi]|uniref:Uncharacterized protein n=1 Tax=Evansella vedderi TaxID=38282 RepID=A0ABU0A2U1_9BACI|nr:hypothetical protein [Evansella vedderi]MDQ0257322.1 hypothetical protein [Evansella vedderi]